MTATNADVKVKTPAKRVSETTATNDDLLAELQALVALITATNDKLTALLKIKGVK